MYRPPFIAAAAPLCPLLPGFAALQNRTCREVVSLPSSRSLPSSSCASSIPPGQSPIPCPSSPRELAYTSSPPSFLLSLLSPSRPHIPRRCFVTSSALYHVLITPYSHYVQTHRVAPFLHASPTLVKQNHKRPPRRALCSPGLLGLQTFPLDFFHLDIPRMTSQSSSAPQVSRPPSPPMFCSPNGIP